MDKKRSDNVTFLIGKTNDLLMSNGVYLMEENEDFVEDEFSHENYVVYTIEKPNAAELRFVFDDGGVVIGINEFCEMMYFSYEDILNDQAFFDKWFTDLFFCAIVIKRCWFGFNFIYIKEPDGQLKLIRKMYYGCAFLLFWPLSFLHLGCKTTEYVPVYPEK